MAWSTAHLGCARARQGCRDVVPAAPAAVGVGCGPGHLGGGGPGGLHSLRPRLRRYVPCDGRGARRPGGKGEEVLRGLPGGHHRGAGLHGDVRADGRMFCHVLLSEQAHHGGHGHGKQQQDQLGARQRRGDDRHHRERVPRGIEGPWPRRRAQGLLNKLQLLGRPASFVRTCLRGPTLGSAVRLAVGRPFPGNRGSGSNWGPQPVA
mmetsp:Transcript_197/g.573  ORF Transcript_197/g.573 Transcript_197/m.573 type:complete len:206 (-) Transcript_197:162-779(-)